MDQFLWLKYKVILDFEKIANSLYFTSICYSIFFELQNLNLFCPQKTCYLFFHSLIHEFIYELRPYIKFLVYFLDFVCQQRHTSKVWKLPRILIKSKLSNQIKKHQSGKGFGHHHGQNEWEGSLAWFQSYVKYSPLENPSLTLWALW